MPRWRLLVAAAALVVYALVSWALMAWWPDSPWAVALLFGPLLVPMAVAALKQRQWLSLVAALALAAVLVLVVQRGGAEVNRLYVLQHAAIHALLAWGFAITLRPGGTALITMMAERIHTVFTPEMRAYTRWLTGLWVWYFMAMIAVSFVVYLLAPWPWWSFYCSVLTPLAAIVFMVAEHWLRYQRHPQFERVSLTQVMQAWKAQR